MKTRALRERPTATLATAGNLVGNRYRLLKILHAESQIETFSAEDTVGNESRGIAKGSVVHLVFLPEFDGNRGQLSQRLEDLRVFFKSFQGVRHEALCRVIGLGQHQERLYLVSESPEGRTLRAVIDERREKARAPSVGSVLAVSTTIANALGALPKSLHGALNPASVWVAEDGRIKLTGIGLFWAYPRLQHKVRLEALRLRFTWRQNCGMATQKQVQARMSTLLRLWSTSSLQGCHLPQPRVSGARRRWSPCPKFVQTSTLDLASWWAGLWTSTRKLAPLMFMRSQAS